MFHNEFTLEAGKSSCALEEGILEIRMKGIFGIRNKETCIKHIIENRERRMRRYGGQDIEHSLSFLSSLA